MSTPTIIPKVYEEHLTTTAEVRDEPKDVESTDVHEKGKVESGDEKTGVDEKLISSDEANRTEGKDPAEVNTLKTEMAKIQTNTSRFISDSLKEVSKDLKEMKNERDEKLSKIEENLENLRVWAEYRETSEEVRDGDNDSSENNIVETDELDVKTQNLIKRQIDKLKSQILSQNSGSNQDESVKLVADTIKQSLVDKGSAVKRDYKIEYNTRFEHFYDFFKSEVRSQKLLHVLDDKREIKVDKSILEEQKYKVRDILINHIDKNHHSKVVTMQDPIEIVAKLKEIKRVENNISSYTVRQEISNMKYVIGQTTATEFCKMFEEAIRKYENSEDANPLFPNEVREAFNNAIIKAVPMVQYLQSTAKIKREKPPTYEQLKLVIMQEEATRKQTEAGVGEVRAVNLALSDVRCYGCGAFGHIGKNCPGQGKGKLCYNCHKYGHTKTECPESDVNDSGIAKRGRFNRMRGKGSNGSSKPNVQSKVSKKEPNKSSGTNNKL
ncbi:DNA repair protein RAD50-like [Diachasma alloeum]|uniref:DNA repair protein RAD50-like n=1 Tax=Diachasma alloeum TaxID=454923 RepID=UPI000738228B|nr:DNA repair protein RAD50-like [Diachasma alloeum]